MPSPTYYFEKLNAAIRNPSSDDARDAIADDGYIQNLLDHYEKTATFDEMKTLAGKLRECIHRNLLSKFQTRAYAREILRDWRQRIAEIATAENPEVQIKPVATPKIGGRLIDISDVKKVFKTRDAMGIVIEYRTGVSELYTPCEIFKQVYPELMKLLANCVLEYIETAKEQETLEHPPNFYILMLSEIFTDNENVNLLNIKGLNQQQIQIICDVATHRSGVFLF